MRRYGAPIVVLNLVKKEEKKARETVLGEEFEQTISFLNSLLPPKDSIHYISLDFHKAHKE